MTHIEPVDFFAELADIVTQTVKKPYEPRPMTAEELDTITDRILMFAQQLKGVQHDD